MFNKMQKDNYSLKKNVATNEKYILRKMKNEFEVLQSSSLHTLCYKMWALLELRGHGG